MLLLPRLFCCIFPNLSAAPSQSLVLRQTSRDVEELTAFLDEAVDAGTEGLIVKTTGGACKQTRLCVWGACARDVERAR